MLLRLKCAKERIEVYKRWKVRLNVPALPYTRVITCFLPSARKANPHLLPLYSLHELPKYSFDLPSLSFQNTTPFHAEICLFADLIRLLYSVGSKSRGTCSIVNLQTSL